MLDVARDTLFYCLRVCVAKRLLDMMDTLDFEPSIYILAYENRSSQ